MTRQLGNEAGDRGEAAQGDRTLRVGLLVDSLQQPAWVARLVAEIRDSMCARIALVALLEGDALAHKGPLRRAWSRRRSLFHDAYMRLDRLMFRQTPDAFAPVDIGGLVGGCPRIDVAANPEGVGRVRAHGLDVLVVLSPAVEPSALKDAARHGAWFLRHTDDPRDDEAVAGLHEVLRGDDATGSLLEVWLPDAAAPRVVYRSQGPTDHVSAERNRNQLFWKSSAFVARKLRDLAADGGRALAEVPTPTRARPPRRVLGNALMALQLLRLLLRYLRGKVRHLLARDQWYFAYRLEGPPRDDFDGLVRVVPPPDRYWADPWPVEGPDGRRFIFFEEFRFDSPKGTIAAVEIDPRTGPGKPFPVLERPYHMSYPQVFQWQGRYYMVPETSANRTVTLFRCESFPDRWVEERDLLTGIDAVDPTLAEVDGRWWLFANIAPFGGGNRDELHLFHATTPLGPWTPHARNPVKSDCGSARPAGPIFRRDGRLYRPSQNCAGGYGRSIVLHRVEILTPDEYRETAVQEIVPSWERGARRAHTLARGAGLFVLDLQRSLRRFP